MKDVTPDCTQEVPDLWPEIKLDIQREYAAPYSEVCSMRAGLHHVYIEAFHGSRARLLKPGRDLVAGNPLNALSILPPFKEFFLVDMDGEGAPNLRRLAADRPDVQVFAGNLSRILLDEVFPRVRLDEYRRGLCVLDPHSLDLEWAVLETVGKMQSIEIFFHLPMQAIEGCILERDRAGKPPARAAQMDRFWGDETWRTLVLPAEKKLSGDEPVRIGGEAIAEAFRKRLIDQTGFTFVPKPLAIGNARAEIVDYLFFASHNVLGGSLVEHIFEKHAHRAEKV